VEQFYRAGYDHILNPLDRRGEDWNPWADLEPHEYRVFAHSIIPDEYMDCAAQEALVALMHTQPDIDSVLRVALVAPIKELMAAMVAAGKLDILGSDPTASLIVIRNRLAEHLDKLAVLRNTEIAYSLSLKRWASDDTDTSWVFLTSQPENLSLLRPLITSHIGTVCRAAFNRTPDPTQKRNLWLVLDDFTSLQKIPELEPTLAEGRKYGVKAILGMNNVSQGRNVYDKNEFDALYALAKTRLILRISDMRTALEISQEIGDVLVSEEAKPIEQQDTSGLTLLARVPTNLLAKVPSLMETLFSCKKHGFAINITQDGILTYKGSPELDSGSRKYERRVSADELMALPDLEGYLTQVSFGKTDLAKVNISRFSYHRGCQYMRPSRVIPCPQRLMPWD
jgi:hypothetical protein